MSRETSGKFAEFWGEELAAQGFTMIPKVLQQNRTELGLAGVRNVGLRDALECYIDWVSGAELSIQLSDRIAAEIQGCDRRTVRRRRNRLREMELITWEGDSNSGKSVVISLIPLRDRLIQLIRDKGRTSMVSYPEVGHRDVPPLTKDQRQSRDKMHDLPPRTDMDVPPGRTDMNVPPLKTSPKTDFKNHSPDGASFQFGSIEWLIEKAMNYVNNGARGRARFDNDFPDYPIKKRREAWKRAIELTEKVSA